MSGRGFRRSPLRARNDRGHERGGMSIHTALGRGWRKRCPHCGRGPLFTGWAHHLDCCSHCGLEFERNPGDTWAFTIIGDRIPIGVLIAAIYFGVARVPFGPRRRHDCRGQRPHLLDGAQPLGRRHRTALSVTEVLPRSGGSRSSGSSLRQGRRTSSAMVRLKSNPTTAEKLDPTTARKPDPTAAREDGMPAGPRLR